MSTKRGKRSKTGLIKDQKVQQKKQSSPRLDRKIVVNMGLKNRKLSGRASASLLAEDEVHLNPK